MIQCQNDKYPTPGIVVPGRTRATPVSTVLGDIRNLIVVAIIEYEIKIIPINPMPIEQYPIVFINPLYFFAVFSINFNPKFVLYSSKYRNGNIIFCVAIFFLFLYKKIIIRIIKIIIDIKSKFIYTLFLLLLIMITIFSL